MRKLSPVIEAAVAEGVQRRHSRQGSDAISAGRDCNGDGGPLAHRQHRAWSNTTPAVAADIAVAFAGAADECPAPGPPLGCCPLADKPVAMEAAAAHARPSRIVSDDQLEAIHRQSLRVLEEIGMDVIYAEAREIFADAGASVVGTGCASAATSSRRR